MGDTLGSKNAKLKLIQQFDRTKTALINQRERWNDLIDVSGFEQNWELNDMARKNRDIVHNYLMDLSSRSDIITAKFKVDISE